MHRIVEQCAMKDPPWGSWVFPPFDGLSPEKAFTRLKEKTCKGALKRYGSLALPVRQRMDHELAIIREKHLASYFLVVVNFIC